MRLKKTRFLIFLLLWVGLFAAIHMLCHLYVKGWAKLEGVTVAKASTVTASAARGMGWDVAPPTEDAPLDKIIEECALEHGVSADLVRAVITVESGWNPELVSSAGAIGLMQIMPIHLKPNGLKSRGELFEPRKNICAGASALRFAINYKKDLRVALMYYNGGDKGISKRYKETLAYPGKVYAALMERDW